ncbi:hypothetical protein EON81_21945 [bacterium]|nr:MAG: hypothetical protein EON81_21945 [bacterium]
MLAAALILCLRQEPTVLEKAIEDSATALNALPSVNCAYTMESEGGGFDSTEISFEYWKDGIKERIDCMSNGNLLIKSVHTEGHTTVLYPARKVYWQVDRPESANKPQKPKPLELNSLDVSFMVSKGMTLRLRSNPPFRFLSESVEKREGGDVRLIHFEATKETGTGSVKGVAEFDAGGGLFIGANLEMFGEKPGKLRIKRQKLEKGVPAAALFVVEAKEFEGLQKVDPPEQF